VCTSQLAASKESDIADEELMQREMQSLQRWLQNTLSKISSDEFSKALGTSTVDGNTIKEHERSIIRVFKDRITSITVEFEARHAAREQLAVGLSKFLISKGAEAAIDRVHEFLARSHHNHVLKLSSNDVPAHVRHNWVKSVKDLFGQKDQTATGLWTRKLIDSVLADDSVQTKAAFDQLVREIARRSDENSREEVVEMELPGDYKISCAEAQCLLELFTSSTAKCDVLLALHGAITDKQYWPELLSTYVASEKDRASIEEVIKDFGSSEQFESR
jgi:hypothetical protein